MTFLACVRRLVLPERTAPAKAFAAEVALVRLLARVSSFVSRQLVGFGERLLTNAAPMRLFAGMSSHVPRQFIRLGERLLTNSALMALLSCGRSFVFCGSFWRVEQFVADITFMMFVHDGS